MQLGSPSEIVAAGDLDIAADMPQEGIRTATRGPCNAADCRRSDRLHTGHMGRWARHLDGCIGSWRAEMRRFSLYPESCSWQCAAIIDVVLEGIEGSKVQRFESV